MSSPLDSRLRRLTVDTPDGLAARARAGAAEPRVAAGRRTLPRFAVALALLLVAVVTVTGAGSYFAPRYGQALADSPVGPITDPLLRASGLAAGEVTPVNQTVTSAGHTIDLVAAYGDGIQTTVYLQVDGLPMAAPYQGKGKVMGDRYLAGETLTDQFGRTYEPRGGSGTTLTVFEPLAGPAAALGGRMTLRITRLTSMQPGGDLRVAPRVDGDWTFRFTLLPRPARDLALPAPVRIGDTTYTFTSVRAASILAVHIRLSGGAVGRWDAASSQPGSLPASVITAYQTQLYDERGLPQRVSSGSFGGSSMDLSWVLEGPGHYRLHLGDPQGGADLWFNVPR
jgi:hypothetical protein